ncbi:ACP phosphodiesterase [Tenacibaculum maritimum]|uniref:acyl carrier protein phosphodiesterase n=1 Tax=Tenacibaculum maritimum TaxID=107401 RepID=UPI0038764925
MNFLAHLYLSANNTNIMVGNFIADHLKGNKFTHYSQEIQQGIKLHRAIDTFTDKHPTVRKSKRRLHPRYRHYDGVIIDIFYDHYLAKNWHLYSAIPLNLYTQSIYHLLQTNTSILPERTQELLPYMISYDWLYNYQFLDGIAKVLNGMNKRTKGRSQMNLAINDLKDLYAEFESDFTLFFKELQEFCNQKLITKHLLT